ncbi:hypothetical protein AMTRI_Chr08g168320 [Amborella trichopoda]
MLQKPVTSRKRNQLHEASSSTVEANTSRFQEISSIENNEVEDRTVVSLPQLPNDIIDRIILKLPLEPICRFKSVCKSWEHHLSSRNFGAMHARSMHMPAQTFGVISVLSRFYFLRSLSQPNANVSLSKLKLNAGDVMTKDMYASNGMICFDDSNGIFICNPVKKERIAIPRILKWGLEIRGFYFDPVRHSYKILVWHWYPGLCSAELFMFSSNTQFWKEIIVDFRVFVFPERSVRMDCMFYIMSRNGQEFHFLQISQEKYAASWSGMAGYA